MPSWLLERHCWSKQNYHVLTEFELNFFHAFEKLSVCVFLLFQECVWSWGLVRVQHCLTRFFQAVPHMEAGMFNISCTPLKLHRTWLEASSNPSKTLVKCWSFILSLLAWNSLCPRWSGQAREEELHLLLSASCAGLKKKHILAAPVWQLWPVTACFVLQAPRAPHPCTSSLSLLPCLGLFSESHSPPEGLVSQRHWNITFNVSFKFTRC